MFNVKQLSVWMNSNQSKFENEMNTQILSKNGYGSQNYILKNQEDAARKVDIEAEVDFVFNEEIKKLDKNKERKF